MSVFAVGDIQGCYGPLREVLEKAAFDPAEDQLWCVGDLVNRGPDSLQVLRYLKSLGDACVAVLGNHDLHLLEYASGGRAYHRDTLEAVIAADDCDELVEWLRHRPLIHHDKDLNWCMVHAGLNPQWSLKKAKRRAKKIEKKLRGDDWQDFCKTLHHGNFPKVEPGKGDAARLLFSAAVLTRSRYCTQHGVFNWDNRTGGSVSRNEKPWFEHKQLAWRNKTRVVYGHWAAKGLVIDQPHVLGLDSGCVWGGELTLARLDGEVPELFSVPHQADQRHD